MHTDARRCKLYIYYCFCSFKPLFYAKITLPLVCIGVNGRAFVTQKIKKTDSLDDSHNPTKVGVSQPPIAAITLAIFACFF